MKTQIYIVLIMTVLIFQTLDASATDSQDLRRQRGMAHKERLEKRKQRHSEIAKARKSYNSFVRDLKAEYKVKLEDLDTEFDLKRVKLEADLQVKIAELSAANHEARIGDSSRPAKSADMKTIEKMNTEKNSYMSKLYVLRKASAKAIHEEKIANEKRKNALLKQRNQLALGKAEALGLLRQYGPILATPIGHQLTKQEKKWNEKEKGDAARINKNNLAIIENFQREEKIMEWKIQNLMEDFDLTWRENEECHKIDSETERCRTMIINSGNNNETAIAQKYLSKLIELDKKKEMTRAKYRSINEQNRILREKEEKRMRFN